MKTTIFYLGLFFASISLSSCQVDTTFDAYDYAAMGCPKHLEIPKGTITIADNTFKDSQLESVIIPNTVDGIGKFCFAGTKIKSIKIPSSIKGIEGGAFSSTNNLQSIEIDGDIFTYENGVLYKNHNGVPNEILFVSHKIDSTFIVSSQIKYISNYAFYKSNIKSINIPASVEYIGKCAFENCKDLKEVIFSPSLWVYDYTFAGCTSLEEISLPNIYGLHAGVFYNCYRLKTVRLSMFVQFEDYNNFDGCTRLERVFISGDLYKPEQWESEEEMIQSRYRKSNNSPFRNK